MYVDKARILDLEELKEDFENPRLTAETRKQAFRAWKKIMNQVKDPQLAEMRERLHLAGDAKDRYEVWKIRNQIKDYLGEERFDERSY